MSKMTYRSTRRRKRNQQIMSGVLTASVVLLVLGFISIFYGPRQIKSDIEYSPSDVVYGVAFQAIHEMSGPALDQILFFPRDKPQPEIALSESSYDFGKIGATEIVTHEFAIKNVGAGTLVISRAYTTCGCTIADFTATEIPPGRVVIMTLAYDAGFHDARGQTVRRGVIVENNDPTMPEIEIWVAAVISNK